MLEKRKLLALDWCEKVAILALYGWLAARIIHNYWETSNAVNLLLLGSEGLVVVFVLCRRPASEISLRPVDWFLASFATTVPLLVTPGINGPLIPPEVAALIMVSGLIVQLCAKISLGRRFGCVPANRGLLLRGPYRFVRHPIYLGYLISHVAFALVNPSLWNLGAYVLAYTMQVPRLLAEERLLSRDPRYQSYMETVRFRLFPGVY